MAEIEILIDTRNSAFGADGDPHDVNFVAFEREVTACLARARDALLSQFHDRTLYRAGGATSIRDTNGNRVGYARMRLLDARLYSPIAVDEPVPQYLCPGCDSTQLRLVETVARGYEIAALDYDGQYTLGHRIEHDVDVTDVVVACAACRCTYAVDTVVGAPPEEDAP